jgi:uncharacterized iron-regulated protein
MHCKAAFSLTAASIAAIAIAGTPQPAAAAGDGCPVCAKVADLVVDLEQEESAAARIPRRIYDLRGAAPRLSSYNAMLRELAPCDVVFVGEYHDDPATHKLELDLLARLHELRGGDCAVAMEMFERDVQPAVDKFVKGGGTEEDFLWAARPWDNYPSDYRPIVEFCREQRLSLIAANTPTELVRRISRQGFDEALASYTPAERPFLALESTHPKDAYWERFLSFMGGEGSGGHGGAMDEEKVFAFYKSQCMKDDTMAESIARYREAHPGQQVISYTGSFHVDYRFGLPARFEARRGADRTALVVLRPAAVWRAADPLAEPGVADFVVFVPSPEWGAASGFDLGE